MQLKKLQNKTKPKKSHNPKIKIELWHSNNKGDARVGNGFQNVISN